jgi:hypothetical protein
MKGGYSSMGIHAALQAANSNSILQQYIGISMLNKTKNMQVTEASVMLKDFRNVQGQVQAAAHAHLGKHIDVNV